MLVLGETIGAQVLAQCGLATLASDAYARARDLTGRLAAGAPHAQAAAREAVLRGVDLTLADGHRLESDLNLLLSTTRDRAEGIAAFFEKRPPRFEGA
jgi:enoyl-CoA hydratase/carnithine racemase